MPLCSRLRTRHAMEPAKVYLHSQGKNDFSQKSGILLRQVGSAKCGKVLSFYFGLSGEKNGD